MHTKFDQWSRFERSRGDADHSPLSFIQPRSREGVHRARILSEGNIEAVFRYIEAWSNSPYSDDAKFSLSVYAGLRACEIAGLTMSAVLDADGQLGRNILIGHNIAKRGRERVVPMHPRVRESLLRLRDAHPDVEFFAFSHRRSIKRQTAKSVSNWFSRLFCDVGLEGCSSHSGRRTFITNLTKLANQMNRTIRDVQLLAGHSRLESTAQYIDPSDDLGDLINKLGTLSSAPTDPDVGPDEDLESPGGAI